ncbi:MAG TPA: GDSL-type esterase/lipase family protein [Polyangiaceae bacterium]|nr:GDSL-type esterase/lipase family protein [Polyangiaceae bacterium]
MSTELERGLWPAISLVALLVTATCAGHGQWEQPQPPRAATAAGPAPEAASVPGSVAAPSASAPALAVASASGRAGSNPNPPPAEPEALRLARFFHALDELSGGQRHDHVRVLWLGDSHTAADYLTGAVRKSLQDRFGIGGPGYLRVGLGTYRHSLVKVTREGAWHIEPTPPPRRSRQDDGVFGLGGLCALAEPPARARLELREGSVRGTARWQVLFDADPNATLKLKLGSRQELLSASTAEKPAGSSIRHVTFEAPATDALELTAAAGKVRVYGAIAESSEPGLVLDTLGIDGARVATALAWDKDAFSAEVAARHPDLAVMAYGTNEAFDSARTDRYTAELGELVARLRRGQPELDCVIVAPPDAGTVDGGSPPRLIEVERAQRDAARQLGCGFYSLRLAMGGEGSYWQWLREDPPLARPDRLHFSPRGYEKLGNGFADALLAAYDQRK